MHYLSLSTDGITDGITDEQIRPSIIIDELLYVCIALTICTVKKGGHEGKISR